MQNKKEKKSAYINDKILFNKPQQSQGQLKHFIWNSIGGTQKL